MQCTPFRSGHSWSTKLYSGGHTFGRHGPIQQALKGAVWMEEGKLIASWGMDALKGLVSAFWGYLDAFTEWILFLFVSNCSIQMILLQYQQNK